MEQHLKYTIHIERAEDGMYVVSVPALPGCFTEGKTFDAAVEMAQDAIYAFVVTLAKRGKKIPVERSSGSPFAVSIAAPVAA